jgi:hypothetical protein
MVSAFCLHNSPCWAITHIESRGVHQLLNLRKCRSRKRICRIDECPDRKEEFDIDCEFLMTHMSRAPHRASRGGKNRRSDRKRVRCAEAVQSQVPTNGEDSHDEAQWMELKPTLTENFGECFTSFSMDTILYSLPLSNFLLYSQFP